MPHDPHPGQPSQSPPARRSDAGRIRLTERDATALILVAQMYACPYDLLAARLGATEHTIRGMMVRWRRAGLAESGSLSAGPAWCWLTAKGMRQAGYPWEAAPPPLSRLAHHRAVLACRLMLEAGPSWQQWHARWRCERHLRAAMPGVGRRGHVPDAEIIWPSLPGSPRAGQTWAVEVEMSPKANATIQAILSGLLAQPYAHIAYLCAPRALPVVTHAVSRLRPEQAAHVTVREVPPAALMPGARSCG
jgi:hypothetical protein